MLPPPPATPRTLIVKLEPTSRAFLVGGTFSRKHHITRILCSSDRTANAARCAPTETPGAPRGGHMGAAARQAPALSERYRRRYRKRAPSSYTSRTQ